MPATIVLGSDPTGVARGARYLRSGQPVGMPTETVYGLAAPVSDADAVAAVFAVKERPLFDPLIVHVAGDDVAREVAGVADLGRLDAAARAVVERLWSRFWPGPLTLVLPRAAGVPDLVTAGLGTVAVRVPRHDVAAALIRAAGSPLVAPSANRFGRISPTTAASVIAELGGRIVAVVDGGPCEVGVESAVVAVEPGGALRLLRPGGVALEALREVAPVVEATGSPASPGHTPSHYAPRTPLVLLPDRVEAVPAGALADVEGPVGLLRAVGAPAAAQERLASLGLDVAAVRTLSERGDAREAARALFAALRELDGAGASAILAEPWPESEGLGHAIRDRLRRAAGLGWSGSGPT
jgi:L-threonylcarbamoyladenylate synthase